MREQENSRDEPAKPIDREYSQPTETGHAADALRDGAGELVAVEIQSIETGHAADALRDGAGELVAVEAPAAVGERRRECERERRC